MQYRSLKGSSPIVSFAEATVKGQAPDKGLYFPVSVPKFQPSFLASIQSASKESIGVTTLSPYIGDDMPADTLAEIVTEAIDFPFPLVEVSQGIYALELFHGPTLAFKDVGARFMSRCLGYFNRGSDKHVTVLVATSGDTGGAVANGFLGVEGVEVIILYPSGKVSPVQELQLTTLGQNITALEVTGTFDDCQAMVKTAFMDADLSNKLTLTSANSINVARWLPQQLYYLLAYREWASENPPVFCVPSGNFGNICAGILAHCSGMPVKKFIAACNANDVVPEYLATGVYLPKKAIATVSNAMDVGDPSNFVRIQELFGQDRSTLSDILCSVSVSDSLTVETIRETYKKHGYLLDPHGAVAYHALEGYLKALRPTEGDPGGNAPMGIFLETAHPVKFPSTVEQATGIHIEMPAQVAHLFGKEKKSILMAPDSNALKEWLMAR